MKEQPIMQETTGHRKICIIAASNISVVLIDKIILAAKGAVGAPLVLTLVLWSFIYKRKKWALTILGIICLLSVILGALGIFLFAGYLYRGSDPVPSLLLIVVGISHALSWLLLRKERALFS